MRAQGYTFRSFCDGPQTVFYETSTNKHGLRFNPFKSLVVPRPIGWISTLSASGNLNLAPYSFFNGIADRPPMVMFSVGGSKDSLNNIEETGECTCSLATMLLKDGMNMSSATVNSDVSEFDLSRLETAPGQMVSTPRVASSPAALECKHWKTIDLPTDTGADFHYSLVLATVVGVYIDDEFIDDGIVDTAKMQPISRLGYMDYAVVNAASMFTLNRPEASEDGTTAEVDLKPWDGVYR